jgi:aldehyde dehydrogenase (NAD+)
MLDSDIDNSIISINPSTGKPMGTSACATEQMVHTARAAALDAEPAWKATPLPQRLKHVKTIRDLLCEQQFRIAACLLEETGRPLQECLGADILPTVYGLDFLLSNAENILNSSGVKGVAEPHGTVGIIGTWNYPLFLNLITICQALVAGNCVLWKPSELALHSALAVNGLIRQSGIPAGVFEMLPGDASTGSALVKSQCDLLVFTGGTETGRHIMADLAATGTPSIMELSGNDAFIVDASADIDVAARCAVWARVSNAGQSCVAPQRFYIVKSVADEFALRLKHHLQEINPRDFTPLRTEHQLDRCVKLIDDAVTRGAGCIFGGYRDTMRPGFYMYPAILTRCNDDMPVVRQDVFGPVLPIIEVTDIQDAVSRANSSEYALGASVWSNTEAHINHAIAGLKCGIVSINDVLLDAALPNCSFGGLRSSGFGKLRGPLGLESMVVRKMVYRHSSRGARRHLFPYMPSGADILTALIDMRRKPRLGAVKQLVQACISWSTEMKTRDRNSEENR